MAIAAPVLDVVYPPTLVLIFISLVVPRLPDRISRGAAYYDLIRLIFSGDDRQLVSGEADRWYDSLGEMIHTGYIYRPQPAPVNKIKETYRYHMMLKCPKGRRGLFLGALDKLNRQNNNSKTKVNVGIDINPYSFI